MIADDAFDWCEDLEEVLIPNSVEHIGKWAFENCNNMTSITIPNPATTIGEFAFYGVAYNFVIKGISGSVAETYANENDIAFEAVSFSVTGITLDITSITLAVGATQQLTATVAPTDAINKNVTWESSDTAIATVDENGLVTAIAAGEATITVTTEDEGKTATCTITVINPTITIKNHNNASSIKYGETLRLTAVTADIPEGAKVAWSVQGAGVTLKVSEDTLTCDVTSTASER